MVAVRKDFQLAGEGEGVGGGESSSRRESARISGMSELEHFHKTYSFTERGRIWQVGGMKAISLPVRERILRLYEQGKSTLEIAEFSGFCVAAVR
ncbi:MAG: hypothetical protein WBS33_11530, partial [Verrucomicrobiia bacterium]